MGIVLYPPFFLQSVHFTFEEIHKISISERATKNQTDCSHKDHKGNSCKVRKINPLRFSLFLVCSA